MTCRVYSHPICIEHEISPNHPEQPGRLRAIERVLARDSFSGLERHEAPHADVAMLDRVHDGAYVEQVLEAVPESGRVMLDPDTGMNPASGEAGLRAAGGVCAAVDAVLTRETNTAFCAVRPPGHHAERAHAMGFCLFNNVAVAAAHARAVHGLERVAVVDFDVHHGNGTQHMFESEANLFFASSHQYPFYPGTGAASERGEHDNVVNAPLAAGSGSAEFRRAWSEIIIPQLRRFKPELLIISAGFDAHEADPLGQLRVKTEDFGWITRELMNVAGECCDGRVVSALEGGYDLEALAESVDAHLKELMHP